MAPVSPHAAQTDRTDPAEGQVRGLGTSVRSGVSRARARRRA